MKKLFAFAIMLFAFSVLVVMPPGNEVSAYEKNTIETLECDLVSINDVTYEITQTINPVMFVEVEISYGNCLKGIKNYDKNNDVNKALYNNYNPNKEVNRLYGTNYLTSCIWQYNNEPASNDTKSKQLVTHDRKLYKDYKGVGISTGVIQGLQYIT